MTRLFAHLGFRHAALAIGLIAASVLLKPSGTPAVMWTWWLATILAGIGVALQRHWPLPMLALCSCTAVAHLALPAPMPVIDVATPILLYAVAGRYPRRTSLVALTAIILLGTGWTLLKPALSSFAGAPFLEVFGPQPGQPGQSVIDHRSNVDGGGLSILCSALIAAWALGSSGRDRRAYLDGLQIRARDLEQQRDQQVELAAAAERARISRELHDVVAHGLSVMVVQAEGGQAALDNRPSDAGKALYAIAQVGRESLADMRRVLNTEADWHPQPGFAYLPRLIEQVRQAGTSVQLRISGHHVPLPSVVDLSGYRIVQESLTNTMKHAGAGAEADVQIRYREHELQIEVSDNGLGPRPQTHVGRGISGMRERAHLLGGTLTAGACPAGGFVVQAWLPIDGPTT